MLFSKVCCCCEFNATFEEADCDRNDLDGESDTEDECNECGFVTGDELYCVGRVSGIGDGDRESSGNEKAVGALGLLAEAGDC